MSFTLVTGATGLVGYNIAQALLQRGRRVRLLVRQVDRARVLFPSRTGVELVHGDVTDARAVSGAVAGCDVIYHAAGLPEQWLANTATFARVNVDGTRNLVEAALARGVKRFVYTSTIDVFEAAAGEVYDESVLASRPKGTPYERSKQAADRVVADALRARRLPAVFLHPAGVYGPGPAGSPGTNKLIADLRDGAVPMLLPGGMPLVYAPDVGRAHVLAEERAEPGSRFILSESFQTLAEFAKLVANAVGRPKIPPVLPLWMAHCVSFATELGARFTHRPPLLPAGQLYFLQWGAIPSSRRAQRLLGWVPTPIEDGVRHTLAAMAAASAPEAELGEGQRPVEKLAAR